MTLKGHLSDVTTVQFFPSNLVVLTGGADFQIKIWSILDGSNPVTLQGHTSGKEKECVQFMRLAGLSYISSCIAITSTAIISQGRNVLCKLS